MDKEEKEEAEGKPNGEGREEGKIEFKKEEEEAKKDWPAEARVGARPELETGRLVMTVDGQQKQLPFGPRDLLTTATMLDGDKVSNISCSRSHTLMFMFGKIISNDRCKKEWHHGDVDFVNQQVVDAATLTLTQSIKVC